MQRFAVFAQVLIHDPPIPALNELVHQSKLHNSIRLQMFEVKPKVVVEEFSTLEHLSEVKEVKYIAHN